MMTFIERTLWETLKQEMAQARSDLCAEIGRNGLGDQAMFALGMLVALEQRLSEAISIYQQENGAAGLCRRCNTPITTMRLKGLPNADVCESCARDLAGSCWD